MSVVELRAPRSVPLNKRRLRGIVVVVVQIGVFDDKRMSSKKGDIKVSGARKKRPLERLEEIWMRGNVCPVEGGLMCKEGKMKSIVHEGLNVAIAEEVFTVGRGVGAANGTARFAREMLAQARLVEKEFGAGAR